MMQPPQRPVTQRADLFDWYFQEAQKDPEVLAQVVENHLHTFTNSEINKAWQVRFNGPKKDKDE